VIAGANDLQRPVDSISGTQQLALMATGMIWTRWSLIIKPKNYLLASVNFFLGTVAGYQVFRLVSYRIGKGDTALQTANYILKGEDKKNSSEQVVESN